MDSTSVPVCVLDEHAGVTVAKARRYANREVDSSAWDGAHLTLGAYHLWVDGAGNLRMKASTPTSDADGAVVGA